MKWFHRQSALLSGMALLFNLLIQPTWSAQLSHAGSAPDPAQVSGSADIWLDSNGEPLPFQTDEAVLEFLQQARIVSSGSVGVGVNGIRKVLLEKDGVRAHAAFRDVRVRKHRVRLQDGRFYMNFTDDCIFELVAYRLSRILGIDAVPPTVKRTFRRSKGTLQIWVENAMMQSEYTRKKPETPPTARPTHQFQTMYLFDSLIANDDRNAGNLLWDSSWKLWMIDHTRAFRWEMEARSLDRLRMCDRAVFQRLKEVGDELLEAELKDALSPRELGALLARRMQIVQHLERMISERGEEIVLFER